jgi:hypothetical protein
MTIPSSTGAERGPLLQARLYLSAPGAALAAVRTEIGRRVLPLLRRKFSRRGVSLVLVDPTGDGHTLPDLPLASRLAEIERCRPFFLGILGTAASDPAPREVHAELAERYPWLGRLRWRTMSGIEAELGGLLAPDQPAGIFFYHLADPVLGGSPRPEGPVADLVARLREAGLPVREGIASLSALGDLVYTDLHRLFERLAPPRALSPLQRADLVQEAFAAARRLVYRPHPGVFHCLDEYAHQGGERPLLVTGPLGSGKSALVANWVAHYRAAHPDDFLFVHHLEVTNEAAQDLFLYRRLYQALPPGSGCPCPPPRPPTPSARASWSGSTWRRPGVAPSSSSTASICGRKKAIRAFPNG